MTRWQLAVLAGGVLVCSVLAWNLYLPDAARGRNDFLQLYTGGKLAGTVDLYNSSRVREVQLQALGEAGESLQFTRLPYYALLLKPLSALPYGWAYLCWEVLSAAALAGFVMLWPGGSGWTKWLVCCWSIPAFVALFDGQDVSFLLLWVALAVREQRRGRPATAGAILALCASKFHLVLLIPLVLVAQRRWRMAGGLAGGVAVLLAISFAVAGWGWPRSYLEVLTDARIQPSVASMPNFHGLLSGLPHGLALEVAAGLVMAAVVFAAARRASSLEAPLTLALAAGILVSFHAYLMDCALLLPALILILRSAVPRPTRVAAWFLATPLPWLFLNLPTPLPTVTRLALVALVAGMAVAVPAMLLAQSAAIKTGSTR